MYTHPTSPDPYGAPAAPPAYPATRCQGCARRATTHRATYRQSIGALVIRFHRRIEGELCAPCRSRHFWSFTGTTLVLGWWGLISLVYSLFVIPANVVSHLGAPRANPADPGQPSAGSCHRCGNPHLRAAATSSTLVVAAVLGGLVLLLAVAQLGAGLARLDPGGLVVALILLVIGGLPVAGAILATRQKFHHCPHCGNEQPAR